MDFYKSKQTNKHGKKPSAVIFPKIVYRQDGIIKTYIERVLIAHNKKTDI